MIRIGVDFGGTKIEAAALARNGEFLSRVRVPNPGDYDGAIEVMRALVSEAERQAGTSAAEVGVAIPGSLSPGTGLVRGANSTWLNGRAFAADMQRSLKRPVRIANDANCFALSEARDGAGEGGSSVFGVIIGTGVGGGLVVKSDLHVGANGVAGEWGHTPLPWLTDTERGRGLRCWCGRTDCIETWLSGPGFLLDYRAAGGTAQDNHAVIAQGRAGDPIASAALDRYVDRLGRALAMLGSIIDPDVIVLGGGMSNVDELYERVMPVFSRWLFCDVSRTRIVKAKYGDSSGVRGAAWLWPWDEAAP